MLTHMEPKHVPVTLTKRKEREEQATQKHIDRVPKRVWLQVAVTSGARRQYSETSRRAKNGSVKGKFIQ